MCGIVGRASPAGVLRSPLAERMRDTMRHRGPDDSGLWWAPDGRVWLGQRRLAIVDPSPAGHQPMGDPTGRLHVTFSGEIYNHRHLRAELEASGHRFRSSCDTEVLLEAYRAWGTACLDRFDGMFAFALHDATAGRLFLARDRAGEKPLFYRHDADGLAFASELKALMEDPSLPRRVDVAALDDYLAYGYVAGDRCMLEGFAKLAQGEAMTYDLTDGELSRWRWWRLPPPCDNVRRSDEELEEELESELRRSVALRLDADVPVGVLLSGGVDSSLVTAVAAGVASGPLRTFTVSFPGAGTFDEAPHAELVARHFGTDHKTLVAEPASVDLLPTMAAQFDEPMADSSMIPTYLLSRLIAGEAKVAVGGDGADELFGGYPHHCLLQRRARLSRVMPRPLGQLTATAGAALPLGLRGRNHLLGLGVTGPADLAYANLYFDAASRRRLAPALRERALGRPGSPEATKAALVDADLSLVDRATAVDFMTYLVDDILVKVDRSSMLASLEVRSPWLAAGLIELAFAEVPPRLRATPTGRKVLLRRLAQRLLPPTVDLQRKQGFSLPLERWFEGRWGHGVEEILVEAEGSPFDRAAVRRVLDLQRRGYRNTQRLFALALFELWRLHYRVEVPG